MAGARTTGAARILPGDLSDKEWMRPRLRPNRAAPAASYWERLREADFRFDPPTRRD
jgi:hypothetical protein